MAKSSNNYLDKEVVICVGAAKAGTSSLHELLSKHPRISTSIPKETDYFKSDTQINKSIENYIHKYFNLKNSHKFIFEANPAYMYFEGCIKNIYELFPDAKIIVMLRHPVKRAFSQYNFRQTYGRYKQSFEELCKREESLISISEDSKYEYGCLDRSLYSKQIEKIFDFFPKNQVYFIIFEDFISDQNGEVNKLLDWINAERINFKNVQENPTGASYSIIISRLLFHPKYRGIRKIFAKMLPRSLKLSLKKSITRLNFKPFDNKLKPLLSEKTFQEITKSFHEDIEKTEKITGLNLSSWK